MEKELTKRQQQVLDYIISHVKEQGVPPTVREIARHFGFSSPGTVQDHLRSLCDKEFIRIKKRFYRGIELLSRAVGLPVVGRVRAGSPEEAIENIEGHVDIAGMFPSSGDTFILRINGDSMKDAGIMDSDMAVVRKQVHARNGDIVVALVDEEATVKRFSKKGREVILEPANRSYKPIRGKNISIIGRVVGILRTY